MGWKADAYPRHLHDPPLILVKLIKISLKNQIKLPLFDFLEFKKMNTRISNTIPLAISLDSFKDKDLINMAVDNDLFNLSRTQRYSLIRKLTNNRGTTSQPLINAQNAVDAQNEVAAQNENETQIQSHEVALLSLIKKLESKFESLETAPDGIVSKTDTSGVTRTDVKLTNSNGLLGGGSFNFYLIQSKYNYFYLLFLFQLKIKRHIF